MSKIRSSPGFLLKLSENEQALLEVEYQSPGNADIPMHWGSLPGPLPAIR